MAKKKATGGHKARLKRVGGPTIGGWRKAAFKELPSKINTIVDFEWGTNVSPEGKDDGYTHCFFVTFKDKAGLEVYLPHPAHKEFGAGLRPILDKVCVVDYVAKK